MVFVIFISFCDEETLQAFCLVAVAASAVFFKCNHVIGAACLLAYIIFNEISIYIIYIYI